MHVHQTPRGLIPDPVTSSGNGGGIVVVALNMCEVNTVQEECEQVRMWASVCMYEFREAAWGGSGNLSLPGHNLATLGSCIQLGV